MDCTVHINVCHAERQRSIQANRRIGVTPNKRLRNVRTLTRPGPFDCALLSVALRSE